MEPFFFFKPIGFFFERNKHVKKTKKATMTLPSERLKPKDYVSTGAPRFARIQPKACFFSLPYRIDLLVSHPHSSISTRTQSPQKESRPSNIDSFEKDTFNRHVRSFEQTIKEKALLDLAHQVEVVKLRMIELQSDTEESLHLMFLEMKKQTDYLRKLQDGSPTITPHCQTI